MSRTLTAFSLVVGLLLINGCSPTTDKNTAKHVLIIGVDGMSPDGIQHSETPTMDRLMASGAHSFHARAVMSSSSSPNWASMIMGAGPEQHGITSNAWEIDEYLIPPTVEGLGTVFPAIFDLVKEQMPGAIVASVYDWGGFGRLYNRKAVDIDIDGDGPDETVRLAAEVIDREKPALTFVHLDHVDHAGHESGHGTEEYYASVAHADRLMGLLLRALEDGGMMDETVVIVTADHGGILKGHGGETMAEMEIPWIISGKGVKQGFNIEDPIDTYDTAASAAYALGLDQPYAWIGKPVYSAFTGSYAADPPRHQSETAEYVVVVGVDGMSPDGLQKAHTPRLNSLIEEGAHSMRGRAVIPSSSSPNWASMIMGAGPEQHGITSNAWERDNYTIEPTARDPEEMFPTMFYALKSARPEAHIVVSYDWGGFGRLYSKSSVDVDVNADGPQAAVDSAVAHFADRPVLTFVHLDHADHAGHAHGYHSSEYYDSVEEADRLIGQLIDGLEASGMLDKTLLIVTADHGGIGTGHGGQTMDEMKIPWIAKGPGITNGATIGDPLDTYDTASTVLYALGVDQPSAWIGRPVLAAFEGSSRSASTLAEYVPMPRIQPRGGLFIGDNPVIQIAIDNPAAEIRYTTDGSEPSTGSPIFDGSFSVDSDGTVCARAYVEDTSSETSCEAYELLSAGIDYGLTYRVYEGRWEDMPDVSGLLHTHEGQTYSISVERLPGVPDDYYAVVFEGFIVLDQAGSYTFEIKSDDGSRLWIDKNVLVDNPSHGTSSAKASIELTAGKHAIAVEYFETYGENVLIVEITGPGIEQGSIPIGMLRVR